MTQIFNDVLGTAQSIVNSGNWAFIAMVAVAILFGLFNMRSVANLISASVTGLIALGVFLLAYNGIKADGNPVDLSMWLNQLSSGWAQLSLMTGSGLVSYLLVFAVAIFVLFLLRAIISR